MPALRKDDKKLKDQRYLDQKARRWSRDKRSVPTNLPKDYELKDADGKVYARLTRGKPVEWLNKEIEADVAGAAADIEKAMRAMPPAGSVSWTPPPLNMPMSIGPSGIAAGVPVADIGIEELHGFVGDLECALSEHPGIVKTDDVTLSRLGRLFRAAFPNFVIGPKLAYGIAVVIWQGKIIIWFFREKGKKFFEAIKARFFKKKDEQLKPPEAPK